MRRSRKLSVILGAYRPPYDAEKTLEQIAAEVADGKWGNGDRRKRLLRENGYTEAQIAQIQSIVNGKRPRKALDVIAAECADGVYGNGLVRKMKLRLMGYSAGEIEQIQRKINAIMAS